MQAVESLNICTLIRSFCPKHIKFRLKNTEELCFLAVKSDTKLKEKLTLRSKKDRNLVNFHPTTHKSKNLTSMGYFCPNYMKFELKKYRGIIFYDTEVIQNGIIKWVNCHQNTQSSKPEKLYIDGLFLPKAFNVSARKFQRNYVSWH